MDGGGGVTVAMIMADSNTTSILNRLLRLHSRSLPTYLASAPPWRRSSDEEASQALEQIASDHSRTVDRLATSIMSKRGMVSMGEFPMEFTDLHDLSISFVIAQVIEKQETLVSNIQSLIGQLGSDPMSKALAEETLGEAKGHLDNLRELAGKSG